MMLAKISVLLAAGAASLAFVNVASKEYTFTDPKGINTVQWFMDSSLEPIAGEAKTMTGTLNFDAEHPESTTGKIVVDVKGMHAAVDLMSTHLKSPMWLDAEKYPTIEFVVKKVEPITTGRKDPVHPNAASVTGDLTIHGVTKEVTTRVYWSYVANGLEPKMHGAMKGDLVSLRTDFSVKRSDYSIGPKEIPTDLVGDTVNLRVGLIAASATK